MTSINVASEIPSNINTLEKLAVWVGMCLARCNPSLKILENSTYPPQRVADVNLIKADDNTFRLVIRLSVPVSDDYASQNRKFWENALVFSDTALPTAYKTN